MIRALLRFAFLVAPAFACASACDAAYEPPCRVTRQDLIVTAAVPGPRTAFELHRSGDHVVASWVNLELPDGGGGGVLAVGAFELVEIDERGALVRRATIAAPPELRERRGSLSAAGVAVGTSANLVYWVETLTTTDPDGRVRTAASLKAAYEGGPVISPARAACERCKLRVAFASLGGDAIALVRSEPDVRAPALLGAPAPAPAFVALLFQTDGTVVEIDVPWLVLSPLHGALDGGLAGGAPEEDELSLEVDGNGGIVVVTDRHAWVVTYPSGHRGPVLLPSPDARIAWSPSGEASVAWSSSPFEEGRSSSTFARREIFTGVVPADGGRVGARERVSRGRAVLAADRRGDEIGVLFESAGRTLFAAVDPGGRKRGGDVLVRTDGEVTRAGEFGAFTPPGPSLLVARGAGAFTAVTLDARAAQTTEIACAP